MPRGRGSRCSGYMGIDGKYFHCSREELGGGLPLEAGGTYAHRVEGPCRCGATHRDAPLQVVQGGRAPQVTHRDVKPENMVEPNRREVAHWDYETGLRVIRYELELDGKLEKEYRQYHRHPDGRYVAGLAPGNRCPPGCAGASRTLYRAPELRAADPRQWIWFVEGEKCVDILARRGLVATTSPGGANAWPHSAEIASQLLRRHHVVVVPDKDHPDKKTGKRPGSVFAAQVVETLKTSAASLRLLELPGLADGEDIEQWFDRGYDVEDLVRLAEAQPDLVQRLPLISSAARDLWARPLPPALPTGLAGLDRAIGGLRSECLTILNGPPGRGKSGLAIQIARHIAATGRHVVYVTLELSERQVVARFAAQRLRVSWQRVFEWGPSEAANVVAGVDGLALVVVRPTRSTGLRAVLNRVTDECGEAPVLVLDYLQYAATWMGTDDIRMAVGALSQDLGTWVTDTRSSGLIVSSVSRQFYHLEEDAVAEDLQGAGKESGQIDFDAAAELFLHAEHPPPGGEAPAKLFISKSRFGGAGATVGLRFHGALGLFEDDPTTNLSELELQCLHAIERGARSAADILDKEGVHQVKARRDLVLKALRSLRRHELIDGPPYRSTTPTGRADDGS